MILQTSAQTGEFSAMMGSCAFTDTRYVTDTSTVIMPRMSLSAVCMNKYRCDICEKKSFEKKVSLYFQGYIHCLFFSGMSCGEEYTMCNDYTCVHNVFRCDGIDDCADAEDEMQCGGLYKSYGFDTINMP